MTFSLADSLIAVNKVWLLRWGGERRGDNYVKCWTVKHGLFALCDSSSEILALGSHHSKSRALTSSTVVTPVDRFKH